VCAADERVRDAQMRVLDDLVRRVAQEASAVGGRAAEHA
jgi:hypothetical protein